MTTRRTIVFRFCSWISGLSDEATVRWLRNVLPLAPIRVRGSVVSLSIGVYHAGCMILPMWRPTQRLTTAGMSKNDVRYFSQNGKSISDRRRRGKQKIIKVPQKTGLLP